MKVDPTTEVIIERIRVEWGRRSGSSVSTEHVMRSLLARAAMEELLVLAAENGQAKQEGSKTG